MENFETSNIKRHKDGSIDTDHYLAIGRRERALQARFIGKQFLELRQMLFVGKTFAFPWTFAKGKSVEVV